VKYDPDLNWRDIHGTGFNHFVGPVRVVDQGDGSMPFGLMLDERHTNANGVCHGGVLMSVADSAMGACAFVASGGPVATIDFECDFISAAPIGEQLYGLANVVRKARSLVFMEADLYVKERRVFRASGIWAILPENSRARDESKIKK
jgi:uncharacterized protein (TIGR00369 family)